MKIKSQEVAQVFAEYPSQFRQKLKSLRKIILEAAKDISETEGLEETLKWGEPSYLPRKRNIGTTVRIGWQKSKPEQYGVYFNCQTSLIAKFKKKYSTLFKYEGKRAIVFLKDDRVPEKELRDCIAMAFTYHLNKRRRVKKLSR